MAEVAYGEELRLLAEEIAGYLASGRESELEWIELKMASMLNVTCSSCALLVWNFVNKHPEDFLLDPAVLQARYLDLYLGRNQSRSDR